MRRTTAGLLSLVLLVTGCERYSTNRSEKDHEVDPKRARSVYVTARSDNPPFDVVVNAQALDDGGWSHWEEWIVSSEWTYEFNYTSGRRINIKLDVRGEGNLYCKMVDADGLPDVPLKQREQRTVEGVTPFEGHGIASCEITTSF